MKSTATTLLFFLLAASSAATFSGEPKAKASDGKTEISTDRSNTAPEAASTPSTRPSSVEPRKKKRCRRHYKTVGIACRTRASR
jgi:hypothetical protein